MRSSLARRNAVAADTLRRRPLAHVLCLGLCRLRRLRRLRRAEEEGAASR